MKEKIIQMMSDKDSWTDFYVLTNMGNIYKRYLYFENQTGHKIHVESDGYKEKIEWIKTNTDFFE